MSPLNPTCSITYLPSGNHSKSNILWVFRGRTQRILWVRICRSLDGPFNYSTNRYTLSVGQGGLTFCEMLEKNRKKNRWNRLGLNSPFLAFLTCFFRRQRRYFFIYFFGRRKKIFKKLFHPKIIVGTMSYK